MTGEQYKQAIDDLGMTQVGSARFFGVNASTARRWISGGLKIPRAVSTLLHVMIDYGLDPEEIFEQEELST